MVTDEQNQANAVWRNPDRPHPRSVQAQQPALDRWRSARCAARANERPLGKILAQWSPPTSLQPVAWLARDMGANRQNVQRIINDLHKEGFVAFETNPHHRRAQLVVLTDKGKQAFDAAMRLQAPWINGLSKGVLHKDIQTMHRVILALRQKLQGNEPDARPIHAGSI